MAFRPFDTRVPTSDADSTPPPIVEVAPSADAAAAAQAASSEASRAEQRTRTVVSPPDDSFVFVQTVPSAIWDVRHALGRYPAVTTVDSTGSAMVGALRYRDVNWAEIEFSTPVSGKAFLS